MHSKLFLSTCDAFVQFAIFMQFSTVIKNFIGLTLGSLLSHLLSFVLLNATYRDKMEWVFKKKSKNPILRYLLANFLRPIFGDNWPYQLANK